MIRKRYILIFALLFSSVFTFAQINTDRVTMIGRNALYYEDYVLSIQYFNQVIKAKPHLAEPYYYRAIAKFMLDDNKGAEEDCSECIKRNPFIMNAYALRADARLNLTDYDGAIADYAQSLKENPNNKGVLINRGLAYTHKKEYEDAEKSFDELIRFYPNFTQGLLARGAMFIEKGDTIRGLDDYGQAIELDKYFPQSYSMRGLVYYAQHKYDEALVDLNEAIKLDGAAIGNYINRGLVRYSKNDLRGAMSDYDKVVEIEPNNLIARFNRGLLRAQVGDDNRAIADFDIVIQQEPDNLMAYLNRALLKSNVADFKGALNDLNTVLKEYPDFYQGFYTRADIKRKQNDLRGAEQDLAYARKEEDRISREALRSSETMIDKTREKSDKTINKFNLLVIADEGEDQKSKYESESRGRVQDKQVSVDFQSRFVLSFYQKHDDVRNAVHFSAIVDKMNKTNLFPALLRITNNPSPLTEEQVSAHFNMIDDFSKYIGANTHDPQLYFGRALHYSLVQDYANAIEDLQKAIEVDDKYSMAYLVLGSIYARMYELSENSQGMSVAYNPRNILEKEKTEVLGKEIAQLAPMAPEKTDYELALVNYNKLIEIEPDFVYAYYNRAELRLSNKDYRAAILDYNEAIRRDSSFAEAYYNRGLARLYMDDKERGLEDLRKAGELGIPSAYGIIKRMTN